MLILIMAVMVLFNLQKTLVIKLLQTLRTLYYQLNWKLHFELPSCLMMHTSLLLTSSNLTCLAGDMSVNAE